MRAEYDISTELERVETFNVDDMLKSKEIFYPFSDFDNVEQGQYEAALLDRAKELKIKGNFEKILKGFKAESKKLNNMANIADIMTISVPDMSPSGKVLSTWRNTEAVLNYHGIECKYNELTKEVEWNIEEYNALPENALIADLQRTFAKSGYKAGNDNAVRSHISMISQEHKYHPVQKYLTNCQSSWDGKDHIKELFDCFELIDEQKPFYDFLLKLFRKWFITAVKLVFNNGDVAAQGVLILVGKQGIGKTRWHKAILPDPSWGKEGMNITSDKDTVIQALSYWIVELGEYCTTKSKLEDYKKFVTNVFDVFRKPYAKESPKEPRRTIFYATTNNEEFLVDETGERRNWVLGLKGIKSININVYQLWAQAAYLALVRKEPHWLTMKEMSQLEESNNIFKEHSEYEELLLMEFDWKTPPEDWIYLTPTDICNILCLDRRKCDKAIGRGLNSLKYMGIKKERQKGRKRLRIYRVPLFVRNDNGYDDRNIRAHTFSNKHEKYFKVEQ